MKPTTIFGRIAELSALIEGEMKPRTRKPCNPRTYAQMAQRTQLHNVLATYSLLSLFMRESWQNASKKTNRYQLFLKNNLGRVKVYFDKDEAAAGACSYVAAPYQISQGSLAPIEITPQGSRLVTSLRVPEGFDITPVTTSGDVSEALMRCNPESIEGDELSVVYLEQRFFGEEKMPQVTPYVYRFTLDTFSRIIFHDLIPAALFEAINGRIGTGEGLKPGGVAYVWSRKTTVKTYVSTQSIVLTPDNTAYQTYSSKEKMIQAAESYGASTKEPFYLAPDDGLTPVPSPKERGADTFDYEKHSAQERTPHGVGTQNFASSRVCVANPCGQPDETDVRPDKTDIPSLVYSYSYSGNRKGLPLPETDPIMTTSGYSYTYTVTVTGGGLPRWESNNT